MPSMPSMPDVPGMENLKMPDIPGMDNRKGGGEDAGPGEAAAGEEAVQEQAAPEPEPALSEEQELERLQALNKQLSAAQGRWLCAGDNEQEAIQAEIADIQSQIESAHQSSAIERAKAAATKRTAARHASSGDTLDMPES